ncbi:class I SAM-dependent methyltransferase [Saccharopolyspora sp. K220]|uniref:class I SAM-dependent methyltransferase n=1 Tax=Saccharopolyspora soli TaxID=2926618 RepID=UPI001F561512|nr:class I SAM-dependent methyltransferase [Saccharopolyspora soli]MCI2416076.1 class I SAM-dependent methyltransferase [Saccharopolyspora soli]
MSRQQVSLGLIKETALFALHAWALDSASASPILGDELSADIADQIDYDFAKLKLKPSVITSTALRAKKLDAAVRAFVGAHPDGVALDLCCGLDTRLVRCDPPAGVDWYGVDFAEVVDLRSRFLPDRSHTISADLTKPDWLDALPADEEQLLTRARSSAVPATAARADPPHRAQHRAVPARGPHAPVPVLAARLRMISSNAPTPAANVCLRSGHCGRSADRNHYNGVITSDSTCRGTSPHR